MRERARWTTVTLIMLVAGTWSAHAGQIRVEATQQVPGYRLVRTSHEVVWLDDGEERTTVYEAHAIRTDGGENDGALEPVPVRSTTTASSGEADGGRYTVPERVIRTVPPTTRTVTIVVSYASDLTYGDLTPVAGLDPMLTTGTPHDIVDLVVDAADVTAVAIDLAATASTAADRESEDRLDAVASHANSPAIGDPVLVATGQFEARLVDLELRVGEIALDLGRTHRSAAPADGSSGPGWHFAPDSRVILGVSPRAAQSLAEADHALAGLLDSKTGAVAQAEAAIASSIDERVRRRAAALSAAAEARELEAALRAVRYSGAARAEVQAELDRRADRAARLAAELEAEARRLTGEITTLRSASGPAATATVESRAAALRLTIDGLRSEAERAASHRERNERFAASSEPIAGAPWGNDSVAIIGPDGHPRRFVLPAPDGARGSAGRSEGRAAYADGSTSVHPGGVELLSASPTPDRFFLLTDGGFRLDSRSGVSWHYGFFGELRLVEDRNGNAIRFSYGSDERLERIVDSRGRTFNLDRDGSGKVSTISGPGEYRVDYQYDPLGRLSAVTDATGDTTRYEYEGDDDGLRISRIERPDGSARTYAYERIRDRWRTVETRDEEGAIERFDYSRPGRVAYTNPSGVVTAYETDAQNRVRRVEFADGYEEHAFDDSGNRVVMRSPGGALTRFAYDARHNRTGVIHPDLSREEWEHNELNLPTAYRDRGGARTEYEYDPLGNLLGVVYPDGSTERYTRVPPGTTAAGSVATHTDRRGNVTTIQYDAYGYPGRITDRAGVVARFVRDPYGRIVSASDSEGGWEYTYRADGRPASVVGPEGLIARYEYNERKDLVSTEKNGILTRFAYDRRHLLQRVDLPTDDQIAYEYRADGRLIAQEIRSAPGTDGERQVSRTEYEYDARGLLVGTRHTGVDASRSWERDAEGRATVMTDESGMQTVLEYSVDGRIRSRTTGLGVTRAREEFTYHPGGSIASYTDPRGFVWTREIDARTNTIVDRGPTGAIVMTARTGPYGEPLEVTDANALLRRYTHDVRGRLVEVRNGEYREESYEYDSANRVVARTDGEGGRRSWEYDARGRVTTVVNPDGSRRTVSYNTDDTVRSLVDETGLAVEYEHDALGRPTARIEPGDRRTTYEWTHLGMPASITDATGRSRRFGYDPAGRLIEAIASDGAVTRHRLDRAGRVIEQIDPTGRTERYAYDGLGRLATVSRGGELVARYAYDSAGNLTHEADGLGRAHVYHYDEYGRLARETNRLGADRSYRYSGSRLPVSIVDYGGTHASLAYSATGSLIRAGYSDGSFLAYEYDRAGRMTVAENQAERLEFAHDAAGRLTSVRGSATRTSIDYTYDAAGRRLSSRDHATAVRVDYSYRDGRLAAISDSAAGRFAFVHDAAGRRTLMTAPGGVTTSTRHDEAGRISATVTTDVQGVVIDGTAHVYDAAGRRVFDVDHDFLVTAYSYDAQGRLVSARYPSSGAKPLHDYTVFARFGVVPALPPAAIGGEAPAPGRDLAREGATAYLSYLNLGRDEALTLSAAFREIHPLRKTGGSTYQQVWTEEFAYNAAGDRTEWRTGWGRLEYTFDEKGRLAKVGALAYSYDMAGNLTGERGPAGSASFSYSAQQRVTSARVPGSTVSYGYDALGRRTFRTEVAAHDQTGAIDRSMLRKPVPGQADSRLSVYRYDGVMPIVASREESLVVAVAASDDIRREPTTPSSRYRPWPSGDPLGRSTAHQRTDYSETTYGRQTIAVTGPAGPVHLIPDSRGSVRLATDSVGRTVETYSYDAYGSALLGTPGPRQPYGYTGKPLDPATGSWNYGFRDYHPTLGRFATPDPIRDGTNWYTYVNADPVNFVDPWGLSPVSDDGAGGWGVVADPYAHMRPGMVYAPGSGTAYVFPMESESNPSAASKAYGNAVIIDHGGGRMSALAHLESFSVSDGEYLAQGAEVGTMGASTSAPALVGWMQPHLHWAVKDSVNVPESSAYWSSSYFWKNNQTNELELRIELYRATPAGSRSTDYGFFVDPLSLVQEGLLIHPANTRVSSPYGPRPLANHDMHYGVDYATTGTVR